MKKENKQALISLSLAGAIGYYLYNKLTASGFAIKKSDFSAKEQTKKDLSWRPGDDAIDDLFEDAVMEEPDVVEEEIVEEVVEEAVEEDVLDNAVVCPACGASVADDEKFCQECGAKLIEDEEESFAADLEIDPPLEFEAEDIEIDVELQDAPEIIEVDEDDDDDSLQSLDDLMPLITPVELDDDDDDDDNDTPVDELFDAMNDEQKEEVDEDGKVMENSEPLHKVDNNEPSAKEEFQSIMDFFNTL